MWSCNLLENCLVFSPNGDLHNCCIPVHGKDAWPYIGTYTGGPLPVNLIVDSRQKLRDALAKGDFGPCAGCTYLRETKQPTTPYLFQCFCVQHYTVCNLRCSYCFWLTTFPADFGRIPYPMLPLLREIFEKKYFDPTGRILWGGGEPALLNEFGDCLDLCLQNDVPVDISSNATIFSEAILRGLKSGKCSLCVSVDAGTPDTYRKMKLLDAYDVVWQNLGKYAEMNASSIAIKYLVTKENGSETDVKGFVNSLATSGIRCPIVIDVPPNMHPFGEDIINSVAALTRELRDRRYSVSVGLHGAVRLPHERLAERVEARIALLHKHAAASGG